GTMKKALALRVAIVLCAGGAVAQERYPQKPLRIVVPFAPGGSTDIIARLIGERLSGTLGQPVVIENRPGAAGNIGAEIVARSASDGYTLLMATTGVMSINNALYQNMSFDSSTNFDYVVFVASITNVLIVAADSPLHNVAELIAAAKRSPGKLSFASSGAGSSTHMSAELFKIMAGVDLLHVPYKGSGPALRDVIARLNREINAILAAPEMRQRLADQGAEAVGGTPEVFAEHAKRERDKWSRVIRDANIAVN